MSQTPRTDKEAANTVGFYSCSTVPADFARKLEIEAGRLKAELETARIGEKQAVWENTELEQQLDAANKAAAEMREVLSDVEQNLVPLAHTVKLHCASECPACFRRLMIRHALSPSCGSDYEPKEKREKVEALLREFVAAMERYQMAVDEEPPFVHRELMRRANELLGGTQTEQALDATMK